MRIILSIILILSFCGAMYWVVTSQPKQGVYVEKSTELTLPSGKKIKSLGYEPIYMPQAKQEDKIVVFSYESKIPLTDINNLQKEVDEIWDAIKIKVEGDNFYNAVISANEPYTGKIVTHKKNIDFHYKRSPGGEWSKT